MYKKNKKIGVLEENTEDKMARESRYDGYEEVLERTWTLDCPSQKTEVTSTPTRPVENVVLTTKGLQERNI